MWEHSESSVNPILKSAEVIVQRPIKTSKLQSEVNTAERIKWIWVGNLGYVIDRESDVSFIFTFKR